jgi:hypothetical protein
VAGAGGAVGPFQIAISPAAPPNDSCSAPLFLPFNIATAGSNTGASGTDQSTCGAADTRDVWFSFSPSATGTYQFFTCGPGTLDTTVAVYSACPGTGAQLACNDNDAAFCGGGPAAVRSRAAATLTAGQDYLVRVAGVNGSEGTFTLTANFAPPPNDTCATAASVGVGSFAFDTLGADTEPVFLDDSCNLGFNLLNNDIWFRFAAPASGPMVASLCNSDFDTAITISDAAPGCGAGQYSAIACNDDADCDHNPNTPDIQSKIQFFATGGSAYLIRIGSRMPGGGSGVLVLGEPGSDCPCEADGVPGLTISDVFHFLGDWFAGAGDFDGDGVSSIADIFQYLSCWFSRMSDC